jgi:hypothetical protein
MAQTESGDITLNVARLSALVSSIAAALYAVLPVDPLPIVDLLIASGPLWAVVLWLQKDARRTGVAPVLDLGYFLVFGWPIAIPWYVFKTRGRGGWSLLLGLIGLIVSPSVTGGVVRLLFT